MKRRLAVILLAALFCFIAGTAFAGMNEADIINKANEDTNGHFTPANKVGKPLRLHEIYRGQVQGPIFDILDGFKEMGVDAPFYVLTWGDPHGDMKGDHKRYIGYTKLDEDFTNPAFLHDAWAGGKLEDRNWILEPWGNGVIQSRYGIRDNDYDGDPKYLPSMHLGLLAYYKDVVYGPRQRPEFWDNLHQYVHILTPPSTYTWGMGRMWHQLPNGSVWYASVPLAPLGLLVDADVSVRIEPAEITAKPGEEVTFTAVLKVKKAPKQVGFAGEQLNFDYWYVNPMADHKVGDRYFPVTLEPAEGSPPFIDRKGEQVLKLDEGKEYRYNLKVRAQSIPTTVSVDVIPGMPVVDDPDWSDNLAGAKINLDLPNLIAISIDPGVSGEAEPGTRYQGKATFKNESPQALENVPVGVFHREYRAVLKDAAGNEVRYASFAPGEEKTFWFNWTSPTAGMTRLTGVIDAPPLEDKYQEISEADNKVAVDVKVRDVDNSNPGDRRLNLQAYSKPGEDIYGVWHDARKREPFTAKWTDDVHATLTVDRPTPPRGSLDWWEISWAKITYPRVADDFSFGNPVPPEGTVTKSMSVPGAGLEEQKQATLTFTEDWALDGFPVHNMMTGEDMAVYPKKYLVSVSFKVTYQYTYWVTECDEDDCWSYPVTETRSYTDTATANLLVNGAGTILYGS